MKKFVKSILLLPLLVAGVSCYETDSNKDTTPTNPTPSTPTVVKVTGVTLDTTSKTIEVGSTFTLTPTVAPNNATNKGVTWASSDNSIATVSNAGLVTAVAQGSATITVTTVDGKFTSSCTVNVTSLVVEKDEIKVLVDDEIGKTKTIVASAYPTTDTITYKSSDENVVTVSEDGVITGVSANQSATITVSSSSGVSKEVTVNTYDVENYFFVNGTSILGTIDADVVDLELPTTYSGTTLTSIAEGAFYNLDSLENLVIPEGYTSIGNFSFLGASSLENISTPSTMTFGNTQKFYFVSSHNSLKNWEIKSANYECAYLSNGSKLVYNTSTKTSLYAFNSPNGLLFDVEAGDPEITTIGFGTYVFVDSLVDVVIPSSITAVEGIGIAGCANLQSLVFKSYIKKANLIYYSIVNLPSLKTVKIDAEEPTDGKLFVDYIITKNSDGVETNALFAQASGTSGTSSKINLRIVGNEKENPLDNIYFKDSTNSISASEIVVTPYSLFSPLQKAKNEKSVLDLTPNSQIATIRLNRGIFNFAGSNIYIPSSAYFAEGAFQTSDMKTLREVLLFARSNGSTVICYSADSGTEGTNMGYFMMNSLDNYIPFSTGSIDIPSTGTSWQLFTYSGYETLYYRTRTSGRALNEESGVTNIGRLTSSYDADSKEQRTITLKEVTDNTLAEPESAGE